MAKRYFRYFLLLFVLVTISACQSVLSRKDNIHTVPGITVVHSKGSEQFSYVKEHEDLVRFCAETDTDAQSTSSGGFSLGAVGDTIADKRSSGAVTMGGRDSTVLITRELMFRACELILNTNADPADAVKIYIDTLKAILKIVKVHKGVGTVSISSDAGTKNNAEVSQND